MLSGHTRHPKRLGRVTRKTLPHQVVVILKRLILTEGLREGDKLPSEREMCGTFGVSHRVVREALDILVGQGLIVKQHGRGAFIRSLRRDSLNEEQLPGLPDPGSTEDVHRLRRAIEVGAACLAADRATEDDLAALQEAIDAMRPKIERGESVNAEEMQFHLSLIRSTNNEAFLQMDYLVAESIRYKMYDRPRLLYRHEGTDVVTNRALPEHQDIVDALRQGDGLEASRIMHTHLSRNVEAAARFSGARSGPDAEREEGHRHHASEMRAQAE